MRRKMGEERKLGLESLDEELERMREKKEKILKLKEFLRIMKKQLKEEGYRKVTVIFDHRGLLIIIDIENSENEEKIDDISIDGKKIDWENDEIVRLLDHAREGGEVRKIVVREYIPESIEKERVQRTKEE